MGGADSLSLLPGTKEEIIDARVAKLVDAVGLKPSGGDTMWVRFPPLAPIIADKVVPARGGLKKAQPINSCTVRSVRERLTRCAGREQQGTTVAGTTFSEGAQSGAGLPATGNPRLLPHQISS